MKKKFFAGIFAVTMVAQSASAVVWLVPLPEIFYALWTGAAIAISMDENKEKATERAYGISIYETKQYKHIISWPESYAQEGEGIYYNSANAVRKFHKNLLDTYGADAKISDIEWLKRIVEYGPQAMSVSLRGFSPAHLGHMTFGQAFGATESTIKMKRMAQLSYALTRFCNFHEEECHLQ